MFFRDLILKSDVTMRVTLAEVRLPVRMGHRDAKSVFGEPLARQLAAAGMGTVVRLVAHESAPDEICGLTIYLGLNTSSRESLETVGRMLEHLHAPHGSSIRITDHRRAPHVFGVTEGVEISVDNTLAPDAEHRRDLARACASAMKGFAISRGWTRRDDQTVFYFYGENFQRMRETLARLFEANPALSGIKTRRLA